VKKLFLDSDIILDALLKRPDFYLPAANVIQLAHKKQLKCIVSATAFLNIHYFLNKYDRVNTMNLLKALRQIVSIVEVDEQIIDLALESPFKDFEDAIQFYAAKSANADFIITRNIKDYKHSTIPVLTAEQFLRTQL
jgi:predicted nucleic acid-binding protein